mmetsp:Transcript_40018/g.95095  ORF Transcript_40018/g.95095 Transcript_40018/m.95095 type:complete len:296 (-) Transcript_40018:152-1039(-)
MVFGVSFGEILVCVGFGAALLGTKDIPYIARKAGFVVGRTAAFLFKTRESAYKYAQEAQLVEVSCWRCTFNKHSQRLSRGFWSARGTVCVTSVRVLDSNWTLRFEIRLCAAQTPQLHREVTQGVNQLNNIREELQSGVRFLSNPVTFSGSAARDRSGEAPHARPSREVDAALEQPGHQPAGQGDPREAPAAPPPEARLPAEGPPAPEGPPSPAGPGSGSGGGAAVLPVSAVSAGIAPDWSGKFPTGSDILLDAVLEQRVAMRAKAFLDAQGPQGGGAGMGPPPDGMEGGGGGGGG